MYTIEDIINKVKTYISNADTDLILRVYLYAYEMHKDDERLSGLPFIQHPLAVADIVATMRLDVPSICTALLHDVREDAPDRSKDLAERFGNDISFIVEGVTKLKKHSFVMKQQRDAESFRKMIIAMSKDIRVLLVKLADRLNNMRELQYQPLEKQKEIANETLHIYAPLANRLGLMWIKQEIEDLSFKYLLPDEYNGLKECVDRRVKEKGKYIREVIEIIKEMLIDAGLKGFEVQGRVKNLWGIYRKMKERQIDLDHVYDFIAFRIIVREITECYVVLGLLHNRWQLIPGRFKDFISMKKPNGYQSLHTSIFGHNNEPMEVQIRTFEMHQVAERGIAAHWKYKDDGKIDQREEDKMRWLQQLVEWAKEIKNPSEFMDGLRQDLYKDEIYVFTPKGDLKILPRGSTVIDFAFEIHTEVGLHCCGGKVFGSLVPLNYQLKTGEIVEVLTNRIHYPSKDWLKMVVSSKAKSKVKAFIRAQERSHAIEIGRELFEKELKKYNLSIKKIKKEIENEILSQLKFNSFDDLLAAIGAEKVAPQSLISQLRSKVEFGEERKEEKIESRSLLELFKKRKEGIEVDGVEDVMMHLAKCCNPIPGDKIVGFVTRGRGVTIHNAGCELLENISTERIVQAYWTKSKEGIYKVPIKIKCEDEKGILASITKEISEKDVNIISISAQPPKGSAAEIHLILGVQDLEQLKATLSSIAKVKGVYLAQRMRQKL